MNTSLSLTRSELDSLDSELEAFVPVSILGELSLERALCHLLFIAEIGEKTKKIKKLGHAGLDVAVTWSYANCKKPNARNLNLQVDGRHFEVALDIYHKARNYEAVSGIMYLLYKGKLTGTRENNLIETEVATAYDLGMAASDSELFGSNDPMYELPDNSQIALHYKGCMRRTAGKGKLKYTLTDGLFTSVLALVHEVAEKSWQLDPLLDVGGYTLGDYRQFVEALAAFAHIHHYCNAAPPSQEVSFKNITFTTLLKLASRDNWIRLLTRLSGLSCSIVDNIFADLTFNPALRVPGKPRPDLMSTPFFPLSNDVFLLSNRLAFEGNWERNYWKLLSVLRPAIHSKLSASKEQRQIQSLTSMLGTVKNSTLTVIPRLNVENKTDLDLLVLDLPNKFGIALQLKWPYGPAYYRDMQKVWEEFDKGVEKLEVTMPWLRAIPKVLIQKTGLSDEQLREFRFEAMLLSRNSVGFGWMKYRNDVPICSERFVRWALIDQGVSLQRFWELAASYAFKPKESVHYRSKVMKPQLGNIIFSAPIAFNVLSEFSPTKDIDWSA